MSLRVHSNQQTDKSTKRIRFKNAINSLKNKMLTDKKVKQNKVCKNNLYLPTFDIFVVYLFVKREIIKIVKNVKCRWIKWFLIDF